MDAQIQYLGDYCRGDYYYLQIDPTSKGSALGKENGKVEGPLCLRICCLFFGVAFGLQRARR